jgi:hypothetical protein
MVTLEDFPHCALTEQAWAPDELAEATRPRSSIIGGTIKRRWTPLTGGE